VSLVHVGGRGRGSLRFMGGDAEIRLHRIRQHLLNLAREASVTVDPELHERIRNLSSSTIRIIRRPWRPCAGYARLYLNLVCLHIRAKPAVRSTSFSMLPTPGASVPSGRAEQSSVWEVYPHRSKKSRSGAAHRWPAGGTVADEAPGTDEWGNVHERVSPAGG